jgi:poly [ADP-ribose] polymerase 2/3/4
MPYLKVKKVTGPENDGFTETLEYKVLHQANVSSNHNKHYTAEIQKHPDGRYRVFTHYGRLGITNIFEVRDTTDGTTPVTDLSLVKKEFDSIIKKKLTGKTVKNPDTGDTEKECYVEIEVVQPTTGSVNIRGIAEVKKTSNIKAAVDLSTYSPQIAELLDQLISENVHNITSHTSITYTAGGYSTGLGPVTPGHVDRARVPLIELNKLMAKTGEVDPEDRLVRQLNSQYFSLIPKSFSMKISAADMIIDAKALETEFDILDQLATAVTMGAAMSGSTSSRMNALGTDIEVLKDREERARLNKFIISTKADNHRYDEVWRYSPIQYYKIKIPEERARYESRGNKKGNIKECFHGSSTSNCLSIIKNGLIVPPVSAPHVCGRMMGAGAYFGLASTKSARYSLGSWGGKRGSSKNIFMFIADIALGKYYETYDSMPQGTPKGYDSIWAKSGRSLYNDELVTPNLEQQTLRYLVELRP